MLNRGSNVHYWDCRQCMAEQCATLSLGHANQLPLPRLLLLKCCCSGVYSCQQCYNNISLYIWWIQIFGYMQKSLSCVSDPIFHWLWYCDSTVTAVQPRTPSRWNVIPSKGGECDPLPTEGMWSPQGRGMWSPPDRGNVIPSRALPCDPSRRRGRVILHGSVILLIPIL